MREKMLFTRATLVFPSWAMHNRHALAKIMADAVDFLTVATAYLAGRAGFEKFHLRLPERA